MIGSLSNYPSKAVTRYLLVGGLLVFVPAYAYIVHLLVGRVGIDTAEFNTVWTSFDTNRFTAFLQPIVDNGWSGTFTTAYALNILSMSGFACLCYALAVILARTINESSRLYGVAALFPVVAILVALLDIVPSALLVSFRSVLPHLPQWLVSFISGSYVVRVLLLYLLLVWFVIAGIRILYLKFRNR
jgi:hypothetical protein